MGTMIEPDLARTATLPVSRVAPALAVAIAVVGLLALFAPTAASIVSIWNRSETFAHGFVVIPIALWVAWQRRESLRAIPATGWYPALALVLLFGAVWWVSTVAGVLSGQQFALLFMIEAAIVGIVGLRLARALTFPLAFLLFAVPFGEFLIPTLIEWTADFTVAALRASGVPVYREANHLLIPSGAWSVVEACSGIRYLIASLMVGTLYAELTYRSAWRKAGFIALAIAVPIVANWVRAYGIVMLGHLSDNRIAVGVDHLIYGWIFFGVVMALLFWIGSLWREPAGTAGPVRIADGSGPAVVPDAPAAKLVVLALLAIVAAALWRAVPLPAAQQGTAVAPLAPLQGVPGWTATEPPRTGWKPHYSGFARELHQGFASGEAIAGVYVAYYRDQTNGGELITSTNSLVTSNDLRWKEIGSGSRPVVWSGTDTAMQRALLSNSAGQIAVYHAFWVGGRVTASAYDAKLLSILSRLSGRNDDSALIVFYMPVSGDDERGADARLQALVQAASPAVQRLLDATRGAGR
jgi:exosortase A